MKRILIQLAVVLFLMSAATAFAQVSAGVSIGNGGLNSFYLAIGNYYHVPQTRVVYVRDHYHMRDEELPVVFFVASRAHVDPQVIIDLRMRRRMSWLDITFHYGLTPEIYYVPVTRVGPPYGKAYGYYKKHGNNYRRVVLADNDVVNLVNLRFMSDYHGVAPEVIMDRRGRGERFFAMNDEFHREKARSRDRNDNKGNREARYESVKDNRGNKDNRDSKGNKGNKDDKENNKGRGKGHGRV